MNRYNKFDALKELTALEEEKRAFEVHGVPVETKNYGKLVFKGQLAFVDYNRGAFHLEVQVILDGARYTKGETDIKTDPVWQVILNVCTVDDGDLGGCSKHLTLEKANQLSEALGKEVLAEIVEMPTLEEFQAQLRPRGIHVGF
jgi:hypothetical protein